MKNILTTIALFPIGIFAQHYPINTIQQELKKDANAVIRQENITVELKSVTEYKETHEKIISVLNKSGDNYVDMHTFYDPSIKIDAFEAEIFDENGNSIKKLKFKDLSDASAVSGGQLYTDSRVKYIEYTPVKYPYTVKYKFQTTNKNTLHFPSFHPINYANLAIESSTFTFINNSNTTVRKLEKNLTNFGVTKEEQNNSYTYQITNLKAIDDEELMPEWSTIAPAVIFATNEINIDGVKGKFDNWSAYGTWFYQNLIQSKLDFTPAEKSKFQQLVKDAKSDKEKVAILYDHMQKKVRYIGVQLGIGGLSPFPNSYVETKSYGDCKALSNYLIGMLDAVGIKAYHTALYAGREPKNMDTEMMYQQGNHMIVYVPLKEEDIWIEATSQTNPFNHLGKFGANRLVFIIDEKGGKIIPSQTLDHTKNQLISKGNLTIKEDGNTILNFIEQGKGIFYDSRSAIKTLIPKEQENTLKNSFHLFRQAKIDSIQLEENWNDAIFTTKFNIESKFYSKKQGNNIIFNLIPTNNETTTLKKAKNRIFDFTIDFGYTDIMNFEINIPENTAKKLAINPIDVKTEFGEYHLNLIEITPKKYQLNRTYIEYKGNYDKTKFNDYVEFKRQVTAYDNIKALLEL